MGRMASKSPARTPHSRHAESKLVDAGFYRARKRGEYHTKNDDVTKALNEFQAAHLLQKAIKADQDDLYDISASLVNGRPARVSHEPLGFVAAGDPIPIDEVE